MSLNKISYDLRLLSNAIQQRVLTNSSDKCALETYIFYVAMKLHFNEWDFNWDFSNKKLKNLTWLQFSKRKDHRHFHTLVKRFPINDERYQYIVSAFILDNRTSIFHIANPNYELNNFHQRRMGTIMAIDKILADDIDRIHQYQIKYNCSLTELLTVRGNNSPMLISEQANIGISLETLVIINILYNYCNQQSESPLWERNRLLITKYGKLLEINETEIKQDFKHIENFNKGN